MFRAPTSDVVTKPDLLSHEPSLFLELMMNEYQVPSDQELPYPTNADAPSCHITVCGAMTRGKSSLINALLDEELVPLDLPWSAQAVIEIFHCVPEQCTVSWREKSGSWREQSVERSSLGEWMRQPNVWIKIGSRNEKLKQGLVLYDTPGINDCDPSSIHRIVECMQRSDLVLFVCRVASGPFTTDEINFIGEHLRGVRSLLHVLTCKELTDDPNGILERNRTRIHKISGIALESIECLAVSSRYKQLHVEEPEPELLEESGFKELEAMIEYLRSKACSEPPPCADDERFIDPLADTFHSVNPNPRSRYP